MKKKSMSSSVRFCLFILVSIASGCTKTNPAVCCAGIEDCKAAGLNLDSECTGGLVCEDHACAVAGCSVDADCPTTTPYCEGSECRACDAARGCTVDAPVCTMPDFSCGGCSGDIDCTAYAATPHCAPTGACLECVDSTQCPDADPVCDATTNTCRTCVKDDDCASAVCDQSSGACVVESKVLYASPTGTTAELCTHASPCSFVKAMGLVDPTRTIVRMLPGDYTGADVPVLAGKPYTIHGAGATLATTGGFNESLRLDPGSTLSIIGLKLDTLYYNASTAGTAFPMINLDQVEVPRVFLRLASAHITRSILKTDPTSPQTLTFSGITSDTRRSAYTIDRTLIDGGGFLIYNKTDVTVTNSLLSNMSSDEHLATITADGHLTIKESTLYNTLATGVVDSASSLFIEDSIIYAPSNTSGTTVSTAAGVRDSIVTPQTTAVSGQGNLLNVDPKLVSPSTGDFHLMLGSPAIDAASPTFATDTDFDGNPRVPPDIGAYEYVAP